MPNYNVSLTKEILGGVGIGGTILLRPFLRGWYTAWGAEPAEAAQNLPYDDLIARPRLSNTRAITIAAAPEVVWAWLVQIGQGRGGLYSYERLENLAGCQMKNANDIDPALQQLAIGELVRLGPEGYPAFPVIQVDPPRLLALFGGPEFVPGMAGLQVSQAVPLLWSWVFSLSPRIPAHTRLIVRSHLDYLDGFGNYMMWKVFTDPIHFCMERQMLLGLKKRAEAGQDLPVAAGSAATQQ
jgi:hypothetical protein